MRAFPLLLALLLSLAAGCLAKTAPEAGTAQPVAPAASGADARPALNLTVERGPATSAAPTLATPPAWRTGEWWKVKVTDGFDGNSYEATRVVAGSEGDKWLVGMPKDAWSNELMVLHLPGFGQVARSDLSFDVHNVPFAPVKFPLKPGATWTTAFEGRAVTAKVTGVDGDRAATIDVAGAKGADHMTITYDAALHEVSKLVFDGYATVEVVDHGYDYRGVVTVPHMFKLVFQNARIAAALAAGGPVGGLGPAPPTDSVHVDSTFDRVSFVLLAGSLTSPADGSFLPNGVYEEKATAPDGKAYDLKVTPADGAGYHMLFAAHERPGGTWKFEHTAAGPGIALAEGIAYHVYDVALPEGRVLASTGEHKHGGSASGTTP